MSLVASAHRHDLDVYEYLRNVIEHLNRGTAEPSELLPDVWKVSHPEAGYSKATNLRIMRCTKARNSIGSPNGVLPDLYNSETYSHHSRRQTIVTRNLCGFVS